MSDKTTGASAAEMIGDDPLPGNVAALPSADARHQLRILEAVLFAAAKPLDEEAIATMLPEGTDVARLLNDLQAAYANRGVTLLRVAGGWAFRTAPDLSFLMRRDAVELKRLSRAALETLAIIAYHQPVTRAEIEEVRGVSTGKGTLDILMEIGWIAMRGRRRTPGRPITYATTGEFMDHFALDRLQDLPGLTELKGAGLLDANLPPDFLIPEPSGEPGLRQDEDPLEEGMTADAEPHLEMHVPDDHVEET